MRALLGLIVIVYLVGVGVELAPALKVKANEATTSQLSEGVAQALPGALAWPAGVYRSLTTQSNAAPSVAPAKNP